MSAKSLAFRVLLGPLLEMYRGEFPPGRWRRFLHQRQWADIEDNLRIQRNLLLETVVDAVENVPFYRAKRPWPRGRNVPAEAIRAVLRDWPPLRRDDLQEHFEELKRVPLPKGTFRNQTGGSSGRPVVFLQDPVFKQWALATKRFQKEILGYSFGEPLLKIWGSEQELLRGRERLGTRILNWATGTFFLNAFSLDDPRLEEAIGWMRQHRPRLVVAYVESAFHMARVVLERGLTLPAPRAVMVTAGTLFPEMRKTIEAAFGAPVVNRYGSREAGDMAAECVEGGGMHMNPFTHYIEILDDNGKVVEEPGVMGRLHVTVLRNRAMPLIRYDIGDYGSWGEPCDCGRGFPTLGRVVGRQSSIIRIGGRVLDGTAVTTSFYSFGWLAEYQLVQEEERGFRVDIVPKKGIVLGPESLPEIEAKLVAVLGEDVRITVRQVERIPRLPSGKFQYIRSMIEEAGS